MGADVSNTFYGCVFMDNLTQTYIFEDFSTFY